MQTHTLTERISDWQVATRVDPSARVVRNVALSGIDSKNGYRYSPTALSSATALYENKPVFLDHARDPGSPRQRSTRDLVGSVVNARLDNGRIRGDIQVLDTEAGRTFLALAEGNHPGVGMSHVILARRSEDGQIVESIVDDISVDAVVNPATTTTFRESAEADPVSCGEQPGTCDAAECPACVRSEDREAIAAGNLPGRAYLDQIAALTRERDELLRRLSDVRQTKHREALEAHVADLLARSGLPDFARTGSFRQALVMAADDAARMALIRERLDFIEQAVSHVRPRSLERTSHSDGRLSTSQLLHAFKRGR